MDRGRQLAQLVELDAMQRLQLVEARVSLAETIDALHLAGERVEAHLRDLGQYESDFDALLGGASFDPDAMRRAGHAIMMGEDRLAASREAEERARQAESEMRIGWHHERQRLAAIAQRRREVERKSAQAADDRAAIDALALADARERLA